MDLIDKIKEIAIRASKQIEIIQTEEATKSALIMPFIRALGYNDSDPSEVIPEFVADIRDKKGEKVDYAIKKDDQIIMLIECKWSGEDLQSQHVSQLRRYFNSVTDARFAVLTNGISYRFYSDIDADNIMDDRPFFEFNVLEFEEHHIDELKKFTKQTFALDNILATAQTLKYAGAIKKILEEELENPSEAFVKFFTSQVLPQGKKTTASVLEQFTKIVKEARLQFINKRIKQSLNSALYGVEESSKLEESREENADTSEGKDGIVTTQEEIDGYNIVHAILHEFVDVNRIFMRDTKSYCGILLDDNNRKGICRLHFNSSQNKRISFGNDTELFEIDTLNDIFKYAEQLKAAVSKHEQNPLLS